MGKTRSFSRTLAKGPKTTWIWNLHADAHDFDIPKSLEDEKIFSAHFGQLHFPLISGMHFHGASLTIQRLMNPLQIKPSAQSVWPVVGQEILNADVGGNFQIITSGFFKFGVPV
jgi:photosystem I P700 chlorophyll a apoprotein A1